MTPEPLSLKFNRLTHEVNITELEIANTAPPSATPWETAKNFLSLPEDVTNLNILDVGGGASDIIAELLRRGANAYAIDPKYKSRADLIGRIRGQLKSGFYNAEGIREVTTALQTFTNSIRQHPERYKPCLATEIPFPDHYFNFIFSINVLTAYLDISRDALRKATEECLRVAGPGATIQLTPFKNLDLSQEPSFNSIRLENNEDLLHRLINDPRIKSVNVTPMKDSEHNILTIKMIG